MGVKMSCKLQRMKINFYIEINYLIIKDNLKNITFLHCVYFKC